jgi:hypothetical protein
MSLKSLSAVWLLALSLPLSLWAQEELPKEATPSADESAQRFLFVSSDPLGAAVYLDGVRLEKPTPLLVRDIKSGKHRLRLEKEGFLSRDILIATPQDKTIGCDLSPAQPILHFEGEGAVRVAGRSAEPADGSIRFQAGSLSLKPASDGIDVTPVFGQQRLLDGIRFALPLFLGLTGVLTVREIAWPRESGLVLAPELAVSSLIGGGLLGWDIALVAKKQKFLKDYKVHVEGPESLAAAAKTKFDAASASMIQGNFEAALSQFEALAADYPDNPLAPRALFESARLKYITGDKGGSAEVFSQIVEDYPVPELYDRAIKGLADCLIAKGDLAGALAELDLLTYLGPGLTREEMDSYRESILALQAAH